MALTHHRMTTQAKVFLTIIAVGAIAAVAFTYKASAHGSERSPWGGWLGCRLAALELTGEQKADAKVVLRKYLPTMEPMVRQLVAERRALRDVVCDTAINTTAIRAQAAKVANVQSELAVETAHLIHELSDMLTSAQAAKLRSMESAMNARVDEMIDRIAAHVEE